jgi:beta-phosphoglucomutase-like phosphatase (HAD superfamily)
MLVRLQEHAASIEPANIHTVLTDIDETWLLNGEDPANGKLGLHNEARRDAFLQAGQEPGLGKLLTIPEEAFAEAYYKAPDNSSEAAIDWLIRQSGIFTKRDEYNPYHPLVGMLLQLKELKYSERLQDNAQAVPGSNLLFRTLHERWLRNRIAAASAAKEGDIYTFIDSQNMSDVVPRHRIIGRETVPESKPNPRVYLVAGQELDVTSDTFNGVAIFEDNANGIMAAKRSGAGLILGLAIVHSIEEIAAFPEDKRPDYVATDFFDYMQMFGLNRLMQEAIHDVNVN